MPRSGAQMFDGLPGCGAKPRLSLDTERLPCSEERGKIAFHGFRQIIEFKSPVYNSSWSWRILSIYLRGHFPFFSSLTMTDYNIASRLLLAIPHNGSCQVQQSRPACFYSAQFSFQGKIGYQSTNLSHKKKGNCFFLWCGDIFFCALFIDWVIKRNAGNHFGEKSKAVSWHL